MYSFAAENRICSECENCHHSLNKTERLLLTVTFLFYLEREESVDVICVLHGARDHAGSPAILRRR